ncbi:hypothetical protein H310_02969 [Aphanomyces invadans]|uniref:SET domain-containing protein n=1 Tax=Aphanomyces invadans TaxID=157072 RepID=A0A024UMI6_9STRA|nr:hypothetical protein H310_02969 [Aphanomyces invadans]ETW06828.1 hypothetical protein H310_02969 [Aphanomyces invadans]|eukprot:XP_008864903.1 hypothetical protein H310_02969 [Aphanomyces invadans]
MLLAFAGQLPTNVLAITATAHASDPYHALSQISQVRVGVGVYKRMALFNHSCAPNAFVRFDNATLTLITSRDIAPHEQVCISYGPHAAKMDGPARRHHLQAQYFFWCECDACGAAHVQSIHELPINFVERTQAVEDTIVRSIAQATSPGDFARIQDMATMVLHERQAVLPAAHVLVGRAYDLLAQVAATAGNFTCAASHSLKSLAILEALYSPLDAELGHEYLKAAQLLYHAGQLDAVASPLARAKAALSLHVPAHDPALSDVAELTAMLSVVRKHLPCS